MAGDKTPIIKKVKKSAHAHHGGAWKVAYADFVTAMMAFFLLLWLLNAVTDEQLEGVSNYFAPASVAPTTSGAGGVLGGQTISDEGSQQSNRSKPSVSMALPPPKLGTGGEESSNKEESPQTEAETTDEEAERRVKEIEEQQFQEAKDELEKTLEGIPSLKQLAKSLMIDDTPEGLRIQIVDQEGLTMFPRGSAEMYHHTKRVLELVSNVINKMPQRVAIAGHTDATKFVTDTGYSNWELSADRANAARRALLDLGVPESRLSRVMGKAATDPLIKEDPNDPKNRRLSIVLLRKSIENYETPEGKPASPPDGAPAGQNAQ
ncbi:MAG: flagellar motor protein MotB [Rhodospirillales bacterium]|nr:flagellar motor protein MotB [Rhodospirillales bacterium]MCW8862463.1 flagellar motor protein MotB [Rhodospirillales bacterium]MCW9040050.1 flagellar motor protein MotB [Rhodospirillales bacterium]